MKILNLSKLISVCADTLTVICIYYFVAASMIVGTDNWSISLIWFVLFALLLTILWNILLNTDKSLPFISIVTALSFASQTAFYIWLSGAALSFKYIVVILIGAGIVSGLPLYYSLHKIQIQKHLMMIDYMVLCITALFLISKAMSISSGCQLLMVLTLVLDICAAAFLRISENESVNSEDALKAVLMSLCCAGVPAALAILLTLIFSKSGELTRKLFKFIGYILVQAWNFINDFFAWLFSHFSSKQQYDVIEIDEMPSLAGNEGSIEEIELNLNLPLIGMIAAGVLIIALIIAVILLRKRKFKINEHTKASKQNTVKRNKISRLSLWQRLKQRIKFELTLMKNRNSAGAVLIYMERKAKHKGLGRKKGESMREFISRLDKNNKLNALANALDLTYYRGEAAGLSASECKTLRSDIKGILHERN